MISEPMNSLSCSCAACVPAAPCATPRVTRRKLGIALGAGILTAFASRTGLANDNLLDPTKIGTAKKQQDTSGLLAPRQNGAAAADSVPMRKPRGNRPSPSYARGMAASIVSSFDGFTNAVSKLTAKLKSLNEREKKILEELGLLKAQYAEKMEEYRQGLFCSGCGKTRSEILARGETFPHSGQTILRPTPQQIAAKERELQAPIDRLEKELKEVRESKRKVDEEMAEARRQAEAGLRLWRTAISFEANLWWADEGDARAEHGAERKQAKDQSEKLKVEVLKVKDEDARRAIQRDLDMWDGIVRRLDSRRDSEFRLFQSNIKTASANSFRERDRLDYYLRRDGVSDVVATLVSMAVQFPTSSFDFLGGAYRMGDFQPSNKDNILPSVRTFITKFAETPQGDCVAQGFGLNCASSAQAPTTPTVRENK